MDEKDKKKAESIITPEFLEKWANWEVNPGCFIDVETQQEIKDMAVKILETRNK